MAKKIRGEGIDKRVVSESGAERFEAYVPDGRGKYIYVGYYETQLESQEARHTALLVRGTAGLRTTLRQWGAAWFQILKDEGYRSRVSMYNTWSSVLCRAPFIDDALEDLASADAQIFKWARDTLPATKKRRSLSAKGKRKTVELESTISRKYAFNAMQILTQCFERAVKEGHMTRNPATGTQVPVQRDKVPEPISYLSAAEIELLLSCKQCAAARSLTKPVSDISQLVECEHMPIEKRVAFTLAIHQCPREGELAAMDWREIELDKRVWHIARSWDGPTKSGKRTTQALLPRSLRALQVWWQLAGKPTTGLLFPSTSRGPQKVGARRAFLDALPETMSTSDAVAAARSAGFKCTLADVYNARSKSRARSARARAQQPYAHGYDWGWADSPSSKQGLRPGWRTRCGITTRIRFHDFRDTCATHLLSGTWGHKWPLKEVSLHLSHSSEKVTEKRYAHLTVDAKLATASRTESEQRMSSRPGENLGSDILLQAAKLLESFAPEEGLEPPTNRLTADQDNNSRAHLSPIFPRSSPGSAARRNDIAALATRVLEQVASGRFDLMQATRLARAVLAHEAIGVAHEAYELAAQVVSSDGPHVIDRATELAELLRDVYAVRLAGSVA